MQGDGVIKNMLTAAYWNESEKVFLFRQMLTLMNLHCFRFSAPALFFIWYSSLCLGIDRHYPAYIRYLSSTGRKYFKIASRQSKNKGSLCYEGLLRSRHYRNAVSAGSGYSAVRQRTLPLRSD